MKKLIPFLFLSVFFVSATQAQFTFGVKGGGAFTGLPNDFTNKWKLGYYGGIVGSFHIHESIALQAELVYSVQGNKKTIQWDDTWDPVRGWIAGEEETVPFHMNYINLPLLFKYQHTSGLFLEVGLQPGLLVSAKAKSSKESYDVKDDHHAFDLARVVGGGWKFQNGLGIDLRFNSGFITVYKDNDGEHRPKNAVLQLGLFYEFGRKD